MQADADKLLPTFFQNYSLLEQEIQKRTHQISGPFCRQCTAICCKEEICRETIESTFLSMLIQRQQMDYDRCKGWMGTAGCRLDYGRPLVCYEFFCERILGSSGFRASNIRQIIKEFVSIGNRAYGNTHLICIHNLKTISAKKIVKLNRKVEGLMDKLVSVHP